MLSIKLQNEVSEAIVISSLNCNYSENHSILLLAEHEPIMDNRLFYCYMH